jgi:hypothetical protein
MAILNFGGSLPTAFDLVEVNGMKFVFAAGEKAKAISRGFIKEQEVFVRIQGIGLQQTTDNLVEALNSEGIEAEKVEDGVVSIPGEVTKAFTEGSSSITHG